jgi:hypothetical protein
MRNNYSMANTFNDKFERLNLNIAQILIQEDFCIIEKIGKVINNYFAIKYPFIISREKPAIADKESNLYCQIWTDKKEVVVSDMDKHPESFNIFYDADKLRAHQFYYDGSLIDALTEFQKEDYQIHKARIPESIKEKLSFMGRKIPYSERFIIVQRNINPFDLKE